MKKLIAGLALLTGMALVAPIPAFAGGSTDAALALGAFAVFNQIIRGETIFNAPRPAVAPPGVVYAPPPVVYAPAPPPVVYAPAPVVYAPYPPVVYAPYPAVVYAAPPAVYAPAPPVVVYRSPVVVQRGHAKFVRGHGYWYHR